MSSPPVTRDTKIIDILQSIPDAARILYEEFNLPCITCEVAYTETLEDGVSYSRLDPEVVIARLNGASGTDEPAKGSGDAAS